MPDDNNLHIGISAGVEDLSKGLKEAGKEVDDFSKEVEKSAKKTEAVSTSSDKNTKSLKKLSTSLTDVNGGMNDLTRESGDLGDKLQGLSRVGSGVSGSMTGVASGALIATGAILAVAAAIGTALYFYGKHRAEAFDLELQYKKLNDRVKEYEKSLWGLNKTVLKGTQNGAKEIVTLRTLRAGIEDVNSPMETRLSHLDSLKKKYPSLLQGISDEKLLTGQLASVYDTLTASILKSARAKAGLEALTDNIKKQFALEAQLLEKSLKISKNTYNQKNLALSDYANKLGGVEGQLSRENKLLSEGKELLKDYEKIGGDLVTLQEEAQKISGNIAENGGIIPIDYNVKDEVAGISKELQKFRNAEAKHDKEQLLSRTKEVKGSFTLGEFETPDFVNATNAYSQFFKSLQTSQEDYFKTVPDTLPISTVNDQGLEENKQKMSDYTREMTWLMEDFSHDLESLIAGTIADTFTSLGENIGAALAEGESVIGAIGSSLLNSLGKFLGELGKMLISYGALAISKGIIDIALSSGNPYVMIAAGAAAIVVGVALTAISAKMGATANPGGSTAGVGGGSSRRSSGSSVSSSGGGSGAGGTYVFEIEGTKLVGVLSNTLSRNRALGGSLGIT